MTAKESIKKVGKVQVTGVVEKMMATKHREAMTLKQIKGVLWFLSLAGIVFGLSLIIRFRDGFVYLLGY